jgi:hypothetical protein
MCRQQQMPRALQRRRLVPLQPHQLGRGEPSHGRDPEDAREAVSLSVKLIGLGLRTAIIP